MIKDEKSSTKNENHSHALWQTPEITLLSIQETENSFYSQQNPNPLFGS